MKKPTKSIITSTLLALAFGAMSVGTTFALFTSEASTTINVGAAEVKLGQTLAIQSVSELGNVAVAADSSGVYTNSIGGKTYVDEDNPLLVHFEKWAPGDKAVIKITNNNLSNVTIKTRFRVDHTSTSTPDLFNALTLDYLATDANNANIGYKFMEWSPVEPTVSKISDVTVTVTFPDHDNGEILFGDANHDNDYQNCNCSIMFTQEAVQGNAQTGSLLEQMNAALDAAAATAGRNKTMHDALLDIYAATPSLDLDEALIKTAGYVWNVNTDQFYYGQEGTTNEYFKICDEMPLTQTNSIYASSSWNTSTVNLIGVGFDAGNASGVTAINYVGASEARNNVIRTNGGVLTINAANDEVVHYGQADYVDIIAVKSSSYEERGRTSLIKVAKGNVSLVSESNVGEIHLAKTGDEFTNIKITLDTGAQLPDLISRDPVGTSIESDILVCEVATPTTSEFYWLTGNATIEDEKVLVSTTSAGTDKVAATEENSTAVAIANAKTGQEVTETGASLKPAAEMTPEEVTEATAAGAAKTFAEIGSKEELIEFRDAWNEGGLANGQTFKLTANIDISGENWYPIGSWEFPFNGTFDGNGKTISGLYANSVDANHKGIYANNSTVGFGETFGFFGIVGNGATLVKDVVYTNVNINIYDGKNVGAVIGYAPSNSKFQSASRPTGSDSMVGIEPYSSSTTFVNKWEGNTTVGTYQVTLSGIVVSGSIRGTSAVAGITGKLYTSGKVEVLSCTNNASIIGGSNTSGVAGYIHYSSDITIDHCVNNGTVRLTGGAGIANFNDLANKVITNNTNSGDIIYDANYNKSSANSYSWSFIAGGIHNNYNYGQYHGNTNTGKFYIQDNTEAESTKGVLIVDAGETITIDSVSEYTDILVNGTLNINAATTVYGCVWVQSSGILNVNAPLTINGTQGTLTLKNNALTVGVNGSITAWNIFVPDNFTLTNNGTIQVRVSVPSNAEESVKGLKRNNLTVVNNGTFIADSNMWYGNNLHFTNNGTYQGNMLLSGTATIINNENGRFEAHGGNGIDFRGGSGSFTNYAASPFGSGFDGVSIWVAGTYAVEGCNAHLGATVTNLNLSHEGNVWTATNK